MNLLDQIQTGPKPASRRAMLYGTHGIGKSTAGSKAESPVFVPTEDGLGNIDCNSFPLAESFDLVIRNLSALYSEQHSYKTVVLDSLDWLERLIWKQVCHAKSVQNIEDIGYAKGYTYALDYWNRVLVGLSALRNDRGMTILLLAHAKVERFENPETDTYDRYVPRLHRLASAMIQEWCDEVLFATYKVHTKRIDEGFNRKRTQGIGTGERVIYTTERPSHVAKNRLSLPDELPLDWSAYASFFNLKKEKEHGQS